jgi:RHS repeat-associated protein
MGTMDAASGRLHLEIPLGSFPQRGGAPPLVPKLYFDSPTWAVTNDGLGPIWGIVGLIGQGSFITDEGAALGVYPTSGVNLGTTGNPCDNDWTVVDISGTQRYFLINTTQNGTQCTTGSAYATDSSGFFLTVTTDTMLQTYSVTYFAPDGTQVFMSTNDFDSSHIVKEDSNGNYLSYDFNSLLGYGDLVDTVGRTPLTTTGTGWNVANSQNSASVDDYAINTTNISVTTDFKEPGVTECVKCSMGVTTSIVLPDSSQYTFLYDCDKTTGNPACGSPGGQAAYYGEMISMTLPTGQTIDYGYTNYIDAAGNYGRWLTAKTTGSAMWSYSLVVTKSAPVNGTQQVTIKKPDGSKDVATFTLNNGAWPTEIQSYDTDGATLLSTVTNTWDFSNPCTLNECFSQGAQWIRRTQTQTTLPVPSGNITKQTAYSYDSPQTGNITAVKEWKYQTGSFPAIPDRATYTTYATIGTNNNINRPLTQTACNNVTSNPADAFCPTGSTTVSRTTITYDNYGGSGGNCLANLTLVAGIVNHDDTNFGCSYTARGNATQIDNWVSGNTVASAVYLLTSLSYDTTGQVLTSVDPALNSTTYSYTDKYYTDNGANPPKAFTPTNSGGTTITTNAYATKVTDFIGSRTMGYYYGSGHGAFSTDYNAIKTYAHFVDPFDRPTETAPPVGWSLNTYTSSAQFDSYSAVGDTAPTTGCTSCLHGQATLDDLGRVTNNYLVNDPAGQIGVSTSYDLMSRPSTISHPNFGSKDPNDVTESAHYDGLSRPIAVTHADGQSTQTAYGTKVTTLGGLSTQQNTAYGIGFPIVVADEAGNLRQQWLDGFGRIIEVDEPSGAGGLKSPFVTNYAYDALGNLTGVVQGVQTRTYEYDGLSRLIQEVTPESGTITLSYVTPAKALCSGNPSNPCTRTDALAIVTTYSYDKAGRLTKKVHTPSATGTVTYTYDTGGAAKFAKGRLIAMADPTGSETYTYDNAGRVTNIAKVIGTTTYNIAYQYNAGGELTQITYPSGRVVQNSYDDVGHLCVAAAVTSSCSNSTTPYLTIQSGNYDAAGHVLSATYGNGVVATATYSTTRSQLAALSYKANSSTLFSLNYYYQKDATNCPTGNTVGNNGQIQCVADLSVGTGDSGRSVAYTYDALGRLLTATNNKGSTQYPPWSLTETYDPYGNRPTQAATGNAYSQYLVISTTKNQITDPAFTYDAGGHVTNEPAPLSATYSYDGEDCLTSYTGNGNSATYTCDGNQLRVTKKVVAGTNTVTTVSIYSGGQVIAEYDNGAAVTSPSREYIYGHQLLATVVGSVGGAGGTITYQHRDHLSPRLYTNASGANVGEQGTFPFGEPWYNSGTTSNWVFTTYERDTESGNDYALARSYSSSLGRFQSPDPSEGDPGDPQGWNRYSYTGNDPINVTDPSGKDWLTDLFIGIMIFADILDGGWSTPDIFGAVGADSSGLWSLNALDEGCAPGLCAGNPINVDLVYNAPGPGDWGGANDPGGEMGEWGRQLFGPQSAAYWGGVQRFINHAGVSMAVNGVTGGFIGYGAGEFIGAFVEGYTGVGAPLVPSTLGIGISGTTTLARGGIGPVLQGQAGVDRAIAQIKSEGGTVLGREITMEAGGVRARPDLLVQNADGTINFVEVKNGVNTALTKNQGIAYPEIESVGGIPRGVNSTKAGLTVGTLMKATPVRIIWY